jgi:hypothetical protein
MGDRDGEGPRQIDLGLTGDTLAGRLRDEEAELEAHPSALESRDDRVERAFRVYHAAHHWVAARLLSIVRRYQAVGRRRGVKFFFEVLRHERLMDSTDESGFKLNNNFSSRYAREIEREHPDLRGFFRKRRLRALGLRRPRPTTTD